MKFEKLNTYEKIVSWPFDLHFLKVDQLGHFQILYKYNIPIQYKCWGKIENEA